MRLITDLAALSVSSSICPIVYNVYELLKSETRICQAHKSNEILRALMANKRGPGQYILDFRERKLVTLGKSVRRNYYSRIILLIIVAQARCG
jgi:hypothetical protein